MKLFYKIIVFFVSLVAMAFVLPYLLALLPSTSGMTAMLILLFVVYPICSLGVGALAATDIKRLFWLPVAEAAIFPALFSLAMVTWIPELFVYSIVYIIAAYLVVGIIFSIRLIKKWERSF